MNNHRKYWRHSLSKEEPQEHKKLYFLMFRHIFENIYQNPAKLWIVTGKSYANFFSKQEVIARGL